MSFAIDREGLFRGTIKDYVLRQHESGCVSVFLVVSVDEAFNGVSWEDWRQFDMEASGAVFLVKKNGTANTKAIESFVDATGWDGSFSSMQNRTWVPRPIQYNVKAEEYNGKVGLRIDYINPYDRTRQSKSAASVDAAGLDSRFGSQMRAIAANRNRNGTVPSRPIPPPPAAASRQPEEATPF